MGTSASAVLDQPASRTQRKVKRSLRKVNPQRALELHRKGMNNAEIARSMGVNTSTIYRFLQNTSAEVQAVKQYREGRADALAKVQAMALDVQTRLLAGLDDGVLAALTPSQKSGLLLSVNTVYGTLYDKERLETGKSTQNHSLIARMMGDALDSAHHTPTSSEASKPDAQAESRT